MLIVDERRHRVQNLSGNWPPLEVRPFDDVGQRCCRVVLVVVVVIIDIIVVERLNARKAAYYAHGKVAEEDAKREKHGDARS